MPAPERLVYLDTETTGLAGGTGTCAFLIGIGTIEGTQFVVRQFFLRDYPEEKAILHALAEILDAFDGVVTYNGKTFDMPLLETRYALARLKSPFARLMHLDALHPSRRLWRLRLESCKLTDLESAVLGIEREGDVAGSEIPAIYFDYLRTGRCARLAAGVLPQRARHHDARRRHRGVGARHRRRRRHTLDSPVDLFSLSRMFEVAGSREQSVETCQRALSGGLPEEIEARALHQLALQYKRQRQHELAVETWRELTRAGITAGARSLGGVGDSLRTPPARSPKRDGVHAGRPRTSAGARAAGPNRGPCATFYQAERFTHRLERLQRKAAETPNRHQASDYLRALDPAL